MPMSDWAGGQIGPNLYGVQVVQNDHIPQDKAFIIGDGQVVVMDLTRPSLRFPLTEALANQDPKIDLWYFDRAKWPHRVSREIFK